MNKNKLFFRPSVYILFIVYFIMTFMTLVLKDHAADALFPEDRYFESVGAISLLIASGLCFYIFFHARKTRKITGIFWGKQLVYLGLALLFFFGHSDYFQLSYLNHLNHLNLMKHSLYQI